MAIDLIEFPADDLPRAKRFWEGLLDLSLDERAGTEGQGLQTHDAGPALGLHERGTGPGDRFSLPYFRVSDMSSALERVTDLGGSVESAEGRHLHLEESDVRVQLENHPHRLLPIQRSARDLDCRPFIADE